VLQHVVILRCAVCVISGYILSYWNRAFFPEWCGDNRLDDHKTYDTMVRMAGSFNGYAEAFKVVAEEYGWKHIVLLSDDVITSSCWYVAKPFNDLFANDENYTFSWLRFGSDPTPKELDDYVEQVKARTRGDCYISCFTMLIT